MIYTLTIAGLLQVGAFIPFESTGADDGVAALALSTSGDTLLVAHGISRSLTRYDVATGVVAAGVDLGPDTTSTNDRWSIEWIPGTDDAVVLDSARRMLFRVDATTMSVEAELQITVENGAGLVVTSDGASCAVVEESSAARQLSIISLTSMTETQVVDIGLAGNALNAVAADAWITADDQRVVVVVMASPPQFGSTLAAYSMATGALEATATLPLVSETLQLVRQSSDRSTWFLAKHSSGLPEQFCYRLRGPDLTLLNDVEFGGFGYRLVDIELNADGSRGWGRFFDTVFALPIDQAIVTPSTPGIAQFPIEGVSTMNVSGDGSRVLIAERRTRLSMFDGAGGLLERNFSTLRPLEGETFVTSADAPVFATQPYLPYDQVKVLDCRVAGTAPEETLFNSSQSESFEGPFTIEALPGGDEVVVRAFASSKLGVFEGTTGAQRGSVDVEAGSSDLDLRSDGQVLVGHRDGTILALDPVGLVETARIQLDGPIEQIAAEPTGTRAWVRLNRTLSQVPRPSLVLVETAGPQAGEIGRVDLLGPDELSLLQLPSPAGGIFYGPYGPPVGKDYDDESASVVFDFARGLAYAASVPGQFIETIDLATFTRTGSYDFSPLALSDQARVLLTIAPDGNHLILGTSDGSYLLRPTPQGLQLVASEVCPMSSVRVGPQAFSSDGATAFMLVVSSGSTCSYLKAVDVATGQVLDTLDTNAGRSVHVRGDALLLATADGFELTRFDGTSFSTPELVLDRGPTAVFEDGATAVLDPASGTLAATEDQLRGLRGLWVVDLFAGQLQPACEGGTPNSTGVQAALSAGGSPFAGEDLLLTVSGLEPFGMVGILGVSNALTQPMPGASGVGLFCLGGPFQRVLGAVRAADAGGERTHLISTAAVATSMGSIAITSGSTWVFQEWHRDSTAVGAATSNTSTALGVTFR